WPSAPMCPATAATTSSSPEAGTSLKANLVHVAPVPLMRVGRRSDLPRPEPASSSSLSSFLPWLRRGLRQGSHDGGQCGRLLPPIPDRPSVDGGHESHMGTHMAALQGQPSPILSLRFDLISSPNFLRHAAAA
uniref:Uncharacterized protein n=3 Tax=Aegilops tauschii subsp. strangulata TaxID=200361 RepID=A0A453K5G9_AEGTS